MRVAILVLAIGGIVGCTTVTAESPSGACTAGRYCVVDGELTLHAGMPGSVGVIRSQSACVALALDAAIFRDEKTWNGRFVRAEGNAYLQPAIGDMYWYELNGRTVALGVCDAGPVIFVERIEFASYN